MTFTCDDGSEIAATFDNAPDPATVLLVRGQQTFTLPQAMSASGARYVGDGIEFWNKGSDAMVEWQGPKLECSEAIRIGTARPISSLFPLSTGCARERGRSVGHRPGVVPAALPRYRSAPVALPAVKLYVN